MCKEKLCLWNMSYSTGDPLMSIPLLKMHHSAIVTTLIIYLSSVSDARKILRGGCSIPPSPSDTSAPSMAPAPMNEGCTEELFQCPDGSDVSRDSNNNCEFAPCPVSPSPAPIISGDSPAPVPEGNYTTPSPMDAEAPAPIIEGCTEELFQCPDGSDVGRDSNNNCEFAPCPVSPSPAPAPTKETVVCTTEMFQCPDGSLVGRGAD